MSKETTTAIEKKASGVVYKSGEMEIALTVDRVRKYLCKPTRNGIPPSTSDVVQFMLLCQSQRLNPWEGDAFLVGYDGKDGAEFSLITSHASLLKRADGFADYRGITSGVIVETASDEGVVEREGSFTYPGDKLLGAWARVERDGRTPVTRKINLESYDKKRSLWLSMKGQMIVKCAEASALRQAFPQIRGYAAEEMGERVPDRGGTGAHHVEGTGRVGADELDLLAGTGRRPETVLLLFLENQSEQFPVGGGVEKEVEEPGAGNLDLTEERLPLQQIDDLAGDLAGRSLQLPGEYHGGVHRQIAELGLPRRLDPDRRQVRLWPAVLNESGHQRLDSLPEHYSSSFPSSAIFSIGASPQRRSSP